MTVSFKGIEGANAAVRVDCNFCDAHIIIRLDNKPLFELGTILIKKKWESLKGSSLSKNFCPKCSIDNNWADKVKKIHAWEKSMKEKGEHDKKKAEAFNEGWGDKGLIEKVAIILHEMWRIYVKTMGNETHKPWDEMERSEQEEEIGYLKKELDDFKGSDITTLKNYSTLKRIIETWESAGTTGVIKAEKTEESDILKKVKCLRKQFSAIHTFLNDQFMEYQDHYLLKMSNKKDDE